LGQSSPAAAQGLHRGCRRRAEPGARRAALAPAAMPAVKPLPGPSSGSAGMCPRAGGSPGRWPCSSPRRFAPPAQGCGRAVSFCPKVALKVLGAICSADSAASALAAAPGALQTPLPVMDALSAGQRRLLHQRAVMAPIAPAGDAVRGLHCPPAPCGSPCLVLCARPHSAAVTPPSRPLPGAMPALCRSRSLARPSDGSVIRLVTEREAVALMNTSSRLSACSR